MRITLLHISFVLSWSGRWPSAYGLWATASLHISWVLKWSGKNAKDLGFMCTALIHISCVLEWSGASSNAYGLRVTALLHISWVLKCPGTYTNKSGFMHTSSLDIFFVLRFSGISFIQHRTSLYICIFIWYLEAGWGQNIPWNGDFVSGNFKTTIHDHTMHSSLQSGHFNDARKYKKWQFHYWNYTLN